MWTNEGRDAFTYTRGQHTFRIPFCFILLLCLALKLDIVGFGWCLIGPPRQTLVAQLRASHFGVSRFWPRCSCSGILMVQELELWITFGAGASALGSLLVVRSLCFGVTFCLGARALWGHFSSRRPCFVASRFWSPCPCAQTYQLWSLCLNKTWQLDYAFGLKARALDFKFWSRFVMEAW